jgi:hypothetical protein
MGLEKVQQLQSHGWVGGALQEFPDLLSDFPMPLVFCPFDALDNN